jgi:hypothetical protein
MKVFGEQNTLSALYLNIKSAYDNVHCSTLMDRLKAVGFSGNLLASIFNLVSTRKLERNYGWLDPKDWTYKGLPQGSVLSPNLFICILLCVMICGILAINTIKNKSI